MYLLLLLQLSVPMACAGPARALSPSCAWIATGLCCVPLSWPVGDLDTKNTVEVMDLLLKINRESRTTCVMVTHNPDLEVSHLEVAGEGGTCVHAPC